jgi:zona occludens toxin
VSSWSGRKQYEWSECKQDLNSRSDAVVRPYTLPKHVFNLYDSAEVHTKQEKRRPLAFYVLIIAVIIALGLMYRVYSRYSKPVQPQTVEQGINPENSPKIADKPPDTTNPIDSDKAVKFPDFKPLIAGVPESAPAYVPLLKVTQVPVLQGCVYSKKKDDCKCYTKQATIYETSKKYCLAVVAGEYFNPYLVHV